MNCSNLESRLGCSHTVSTEQIILSPLTKKKKQSKLGKFYFYKLFKKSEYLVTYNDMITTII